MIPPGLANIARPQDLPDNNHSYGSSFQPPTDTDVEMAVSQWLLEGVTDLATDSESDWHADDLEIPLSIMPTLGHENSHGFTPVSVPIHDDCIPEEIPSVSDDDFLAMIMHFYDADASIAEPEATAAPHVHTLGDPSNVQARLSNVRFDPPPSFHQVDSPPPVSQSRYAPYKTVDRPEIYRGTRRLRDDVEHRAGPSSHEWMPGIPPPVAPLAAPVAVPPPSAVSPVTAPPPSAVPPVIIPPPAAPTTTSASLPPLTSVLFGLPDTRELRLRATQNIKESMFEDSFMLSCKARASKALESLTAVVERFNNPELTTWSKGSEAKKEIEKIGESAKNFRTTVKEMAPTAVLSGYGLNEALATKPQDEMVLIIDDLVRDNAYLYGSLEVGGQTIFGVPFANIMMQYFAQQVLFHHLNLQQYVSSKRNLGGLLAFIATLFKWVFSQLSTGVYVKSDFSMSPERITFDNDLNKLYNSMDSDVRDALVAAIFTQRGQQF